MTLPTHKTKIVCTIGPASETGGIMEEMIRAGMNIARLNFSHGDFASHEKTIKNLQGRLAIDGATPGHHGGPAGA